MNLFENLQRMNESTILTERDSLSVSEYNKLKIALNKHNTMKANFILHPGKVEVYDYKMGLSIYGAFKNKEHDSNSYHAYSGEYKNDEVTKEGVGAKLYSVYINLIDESVTFNDSPYYLVDYVRRYEKYLIANNILKNGEMSIDSLCDSIKEVAEASKADLEEVLHSKNFIYNLTGKRKTLHKDNPKYNLNLENKNIELTEDFDSSMPNWLMRAIKTNNDKRSSGHKDLNYRMPLDTMKWTIEPFPEKGKINNIGDDEYIALLIDRSGDEHKGDYIVYFPAAYIGNNETIEINGRNRRIDSMSLRALAPYIKEYAHSIGSKDARANIADIQKDRITAKDGSIDRVNNDNNWKYGYADKIDKSGYIVDPNKYKRLLAQNKHEDYANRLNDLYVVLLDVRTKIKDYISKDDVIPTPGKKDYNRDKGFNNSSRAYKEYSRALGEYSNALEILEKIKTGEKDYYGESFEHFEKYVKTAETYIVNCLNIIEPET